MHLCLCCSGSSITHKMMLRLFLFFRNKFDIVIVILAVVDIFV